MVLDWHKLLIFVVTRVTETAYTYLICYTMFCLYGFRAYLADAAKRMWRRATRRLLLIRGICCKTWRCFFLIVTCLMDTLLCVSKHVWGCFGKEEAKFGFPKFLLWRRCSVGVLECYDCDIYYPINTFSRRIERLSWIEYTWRIGHQKRSRDFWRCARFFPLFDPFDAHRYHS